MTDVLTELRAASRQVAQRARYVHIDPARIPAYAASLEAPKTPEPDVHLTAGPREQRAAFWLTLDTINFGSGWFPTLRKRDGRSGYYTVAQGLTDRFEAHGQWPAAGLAEVGADEVAATLGQDPHHELMGLFASSLRDLGRHVQEEYGGSFARLADSADGSALALVSALAGWRCFDDVSTYDGIRVPFLKRAQITAADLDRAGVARFGDLGRLTMFADNLVPHVLRLDGVLEFDPDLVRRIERQELIEHGSPEEVEIRACALQAVELLASARGDRSPAEIDQQLWLRGQDPAYKAVPRHRSRCTAY
jgi:hypothetical protein